MKARDPILDQLCHNRKSDRSAKLSLQIKCLVIMVYMQQD
jgi:hypothetical protein